MSRAATSLLVFGIYLIVLGFALALVPNVVADLVNVPRTHEVWLRLVGVLALNIGIYYVVAARWDLRPMLVASVPVRLLVPTWMVLFVVFAGADAHVLIFGLADLLGAAWTAASLRADRR
jgi:hypothetical protein